jgi:hypothetical protein
MERWVEIHFDCLPLRSVTRLDVPLDASPKFQAFCHRVKKAIETHGSHNAYYLYNASCTYHLLNHAERGSIEFRFEGTVLTDEADCSCQRCDLQVEIVRETCDWLTQPIVQWFADTVPRSVAVEFDRYIEAGDLQRTKDRMEQIQRDSDDAGGFIGMHL